MGSAIGPVLYLEKMLSSVWKSLRLYDLQTYMQESLNSAFTQEN